MQLDINRNKAYFFQYISIKYVSTFLKATHIGLVAHIPIFFMNLFAYLM